MNLTSFLANKCFEFLLNAGNEEEKKLHGRAARLKSGSNPSGQVILPPWTHDIQSFRLLCDGCGNCISSCTGNILIRDSHGCPQVDFSGGPCTFCGACAESCPRGAFSYEPSTVPWTLKAFITDDCLAHDNVLCRTCAEHCQEKAISIPNTSGPISAPLILSEKCNGCGACFNPCPVSAIVMQKDGDKT